MSRLAVPYFEQLVQDRVSMRFVHIGTTDSADKPDTDGRNNLHGLSALLKRVPYKRAKHLDAFREDRSIWPSVPRTSDQILRRDDIPGFWVEGDDLSVLGALRMPFYSSWEIVNADLSDEKLIVANSLCNSNCD